MVANPLPIIQFDPHSGVEVPPEVKDKLRITKSDIYNDADRWADRHFDFSHPDLAALVPSGYTLGTLATVTTPIARVLVDANRYPDDHAHGDSNNPDGPIKCRTSYGKEIYGEPLRPALRARLMERYYCPYHRRLASTLAQHAGQAKLLLDCHSMAQRSPDAYLDQGNPRPLLCISNVGDPDGYPMQDVGATSCSADLLHRTAAIAADLFADMTLLEPGPDVHVPIAAINQPFRGGYVLRRHSRIGNPNMIVPAMMIEVNRGLFIGDQRADSPIRPPNEPRIAEVRRRLYLLMVEIIGLLD